MLSLLVLLVLYLGFLYTMRGVMVDSKLVDNTVQRQRTTQVTDIARRQFENLVESTYMDQPLEISTYQKAWYRDIDPTAPPANPDYSYWRKCLGNSDKTARCDQISVKVSDKDLPYTALVVLQPTGRTEAYDCRRPKLTFARYYDVFIYVEDSSAATGAPIESVLRLCTVS